MSYPVSIKGVLLIGDQVALMQNHRDEWELPGLHAINLPAGYRASILRWLEHPSIAAARSVRPPSAHR